MRYFIKLAYNGARTHGWQRQPHQRSVQQVIEEALTILLRQPTEVVGCGRTDTGVHAAEYYAHFDAIEPISDSITLIRRLNHIVGGDIAIETIFQVHPEAHARFDAISRGYVYHLIANKDPFRQETAWYYPEIVRCDFDLMQQAAALLLKYDAFATFCKTHSGSATYRCVLTHSAWELNEAGKHYTYTIIGNRFLRGMVRLIVGACVQIGSGQVTIEQLRQALEQQTILPKAYSAPAQGLFLTQIRYPYLSF